MVKRKICPGIAEWWLDILQIIFSCLKLLKVVVAPKIRSLEKKFFYDFKTGNYIISRVICKERHSFQWKNLKITKNNFLIMFFAIGFFLTIASYQFFENDWSFLNHSSFFRGKYSVQLNRFQFLKINSLMAEIIKNQFSKTKFL